MKDKLMLRVKLPATMEVHEFRMPYDVTVEQGSELASRILSSREPARYLSAGDADFMYLEGPQTGAFVNPNDTFRNLVLSGELVEGSLVALV